MIHWPDLMPRRLAAIAALGGFLGVATPQQPPPARGSATPAARAVINQYCSGCHNDRLKTAGLALDRMNPDNVAENQEAWEKVVRKLKTRYMPPAGMPRPDERTYDAVVSSLETSLDRAKPNPGRSDTFRRLTRTEYQNAIRDLLAIDIDVSSLLPSDESSHGFDNVTVGELSPTLLERYLSAAQKISRLAVGSAIASPRGDTIMLPPDLTQEDHLDELPFGTRGGTVVPYNFPVDGAYEIQLRLARDRNEHVEGLAEAHRLELTLDGERVQLFEVKPPARGNSHELVDNDLHARFAVKAGPHAIGAAFLKRPSALPETDRQPYQAHFNMDRHPRIQPALYTVSVTGPYGSGGAGETPSRKRIFACKPSNPSDEEGCARRILSTLARRAYRREVNGADADALLKFYKEGRSGSGFENGVEMALRALLVSPEFLFRIEQDPANVPSNTAYRLSEVELASRLSFFLWSSIPDDELLDLAIRGKLKEPAVLEQQVRRMLADSRSDALVSNFAGQWLYLRNLASTTPDARTFPDFDDNLRQALRRETEMFFDSVMREDRSVLDLLRANYTFLNERLAKHYGIPNVYGSRFRRVTFDAGSERGGLLGQGSILTVTSYATRTSPVLRGKWILANLIGSPPPPPPPNVPPLKEHAAGGKPLSMRERMAEHRANPACAGCHKLMDPIGFSLENYDAIGRWRVRDGEGSAAIDAAGNLPDGVAFNGAAGLRNALLSRPEVFVGNFTEKLLTYALGRGNEFYDAPAVRKIVADAKARDDRFSALVLGIVNSTPFQMRRSQ